MIRYGDHDICTVHGGEYFRQGRRKAFSRSITRRIELLETFMRESAGDAHAEAAALYNWPLGLALLLSLAFAARKAGQRLKKVRVYD